MSTLWVVGDSTLSSFDDKYYYPRYGYGTKLGCYLNSKVQVNNLALSGRSSLSFTKEENYKHSLREGIIQRQSVTLQETLESSVLI